MGLRSNSFTASDFGSLLDSAQFRLFPVKKVGNRDKSGTSYGWWTPTLSLDSESVAWWLIAFLSMFPCLGAVVGGSDDEREPNGAKQRRREDRGLPTQGALCDLARTYLEIQAQVWPKLVGGEYLPRLTDKAAQKLADAFKTKFLDGTVESFQLPDIGDGISAYGAAYLRYSCDNSNPRSLDQQLRNVLERAGRDQVFIPWEWVMADAAVSGTIANRRGYQMAKSLITTKIEGFSRLYIDELGRAARDTVESLKLGREIDQGGFVLIGVTDGFDSSKGQYKLMLTVYAMLHEHFVDQLRAKVNRGMDDAFALGKNIQPPAFGHKLIPLVDERGETVCDQDGKIIKTKVVNPDTAPFVVEAFELLAVQKWSPEKIARRFNEKSVGGRQSWDRRQIVNLLTRESYVGTEYYRQTRRVVDPETGGETIKKLPRDQWIRREKSCLRIVSDELWQMAQDRLKQCSEAYSKQKKRTTKRTEVYPTMLFRPVCGYCGNELCLGRAGKYASLCCLNGRDGKRGCSLASYKSLRIVEESILSHLREHIFTHEFVDRMLEAANDYLIESAKRPQEDLNPIKAEINRVKAKRDRLAKTLEDVGDEGLDVIVKRLRELEKELKQLRLRLKEMKAQNLVSPPPMAGVDMERLLRGLRELLKAEVATAAPILKQLTGEIVIEQTREEGKRGATWIARFSVNAVPIVAQIAANTGCPTSSTWEYLHTRGWTTSESAEVRLEKIPEYEKLAPEMLKLFMKTKNVQTVASTYGITWARTKEILDYAETGKRPKWRAGKRTGQGIRVDYRTIAPTVARLRDKQQLTWNRIVEKLAQDHDIHVSPGTARRAYDYFHQDRVKEAAERGERPDRGSYRQIDAKIIQKVHKLLKAGVPTAQVVKRTGCSASTVHREKRKLGL